MNLRAIRIPKTIKAERCAALSSSCNPETKKCLLAEKQALAADSDDGPSHKKQHVDVRHSGLHHSKPAVNQIGPESKSKSKKLNWRNKNQTGKTTSRIFDQCIPLNISLPKITLRLPNNTLILYNTRRIARPFILRL
jgi:hypothetical protein